MPAPLVLAGVAAGMQAVSMVTDFIGSSKQAKAAKRAAKGKARAEDLVTDEKIRLLLKKEEDLAGETVARTAASGVKVSSVSPLMMLADQAREAAYERDITKKVGATKTRMALQEGSDVASAIKYGSYSQAAASGGQLFSMISQAAKMAKET